MAVNMNSFGDCGSKVIGSEVGNCVVDNLGDVNGVVLSNNVNFPIVDGVINIDEEMYIEGLKELTLLPYIGITEFTDNTADNETTTSATGVIQTIRQGKAMYQFVFSKGHCQHASWMDKTGFGRYDAFIVTDKGLIGRYTANGRQFRGLTAGDVSVETLRLNSGTDRQRTIVNIQFTNPEELNSNLAFLTWDALGFSAIDLKGVMETNISVISKTSNTATVKVSSKCNSDSSIVGLDESTMWQIEGDTSETITSVSYNATAKTYEITFSGVLAVGTYTLMLGDVNYNVVEDAAGNLFKGNTQLVITPAPSV